MRHIVINIAKQQLTLIADGGELASYSVSTAKNGTGEVFGSECTPRGTHRVAAKIGGGLSNGAALTGRRPTGECWSAELHKQQPSRDWILSRILWLEGCEPGINRGVDRYNQLVDSMQRYIYIHGTPDAEPIGQPLSHGCIRMRNSDIIDLYNQIEPGTPVEIKEQ